MKTEKEPTTEVVEGWIKKWEANIAFIKLRIDQQNATQVRGRKYFPYEIEDEQAKIDYVKVRYKYLLD